MTDSVYQTEGEPMSAQKREPGCNPTEQYYLWRGPFQSDSWRYEWTVTGWREGRGGERLTLAICPTYEAALAAFRLITIGCTPGTHRIPIPVERCVCVHAPEEHNGQVGCNIRGCACRANGDRACWP